MEGEKYYAPRRPKPPLPGKRLAPLEEVAEPQAKLGQHSGIGYELVLAFDAPVLHMVEQPVDVLVRVDELKKQEEEVRRLLWTPTNQLALLQQQKALEHFSKRKRKKRRKRKVPKPSSSCSSRSSRGVRAARTQNSEHYFHARCLVRQDTFSYVCFGGFWGDPLHLAVICSVLGVTTEYKDCGFLGDDAMFPYFRYAWYDSG